MGSPIPGRVTALLCALGAFPALGPGTPALLPVPVAAATGAPRPPVSASPPPRKAAARSQPDDRAFLLRAQEHLRRRESEKAVAALKQGLARHPRSIALHLAVAGILARQGDHAR